MARKKILVIGSGGREHALGWKIAQSEEVSEVLYAPGNAGTQEGKCRNVPVDGSKKENFSSIADLIEYENIDLTVVGPEAPLTDGLVDYLNSKGHQRIFSPTQAASQLEADKFFSFDLMRLLNIPQADSAKCYTTEDVIRAIKERANNCGIVIKARGLTAGKGVMVCDSKEKALEEICKHAQNYGPEVLIAERLFGQEFSVFGISDGNRVFPFGVSIKDHKPLLDGDKGPNTGGMGAYGPAPIAPLDVVADVAENIMTLVVQKMKADGIKYKGFMYAGMIMTDGIAKVLEFNVRFGDPEAQPAMMMIKKDLYEMLSLALNGKFKENDIELNPGAACCVVLASKGYPGDYKKGLPISSLDKASSIDSVKVFHAGTKFDGNVVVTAGGRVLGVTGYSASGIREAKRLAYESVSKINIPGGFHYRKDIADKA